MNRTPAYQAARLAMLQQPQQQHPKPVRVPDVPLHNRVGVPGSTREQHPRCQSTT